MKAGHGPRVLSKFEPVTLCFRVRACVQFVLLGFRKNRASYSARPLLSKWMSCKCYIWINEQYPGHFERSSPFRRISPKQLTLCCNLSICQNVSVKRFCVINAIFRFRTLFDCVKVNLPIPECGDHFTGNLLWVSSECEALFLES